MPISCNYPKILRNDNITDERDEVFGFTSLNISHTVLDRANTCLNLKDDAVVRGDGKHPDSEQDYTPVIKE
jgi:hypothetical protein